MTRERLIELWPVIEAFKDGKEIQCDGIYNVDNRIWTSAGNPTWSDTLAYRIKPTPNIRAWTAKDVPAGCKIHFKGSECWLAPLEAGFEAIYFCDLANKSMRAVSYETLLNGYEHSTDNGATWKPCGVEQ